MDRAGRLVIPKALRDQLGIEAGQPLQARVADGRLEIEPAPLEVTLREVDGILVIVPVEPLPPLTRDEVRAALESVRR
jgi:AbrB family looped-hinge helix DNA binding protein